MSPTPSWVSAQPRRPGPDHPLWTRVGAASPGTSSRLQPVGSGPGALRDLSTSKPYQPKEAGRRVSDAATPPPPLEPR